MVGVAGACVAVWLYNLTALYPSGAAGRGAKALRERRAPPWRAVVCRVQTCTELAEENRRDLSAGSQQDQEHILNVGKFGLRTPGGFWQFPLYEGTAIDTLVLYQDLLISDRFKVVTHTPQSPLLL